jgi:hypothetical protein
MTAAVHPVPEPRQRRRQALGQARPQWAAAPFITYRMAVLKNAAEVSLEAGNSPKMIFEHYRGLRTEAEGKEWFSVMPAGGEKIVALRIA